jgi:hypothetical protein
MLLIVLPNVIESRVFAVCPSAPEEAVAPSTAVPFPLPEGRTVISCPVWLGVPFISHVSVGVVVK